MSYVAQIGDFVSWDFMSGDFLTGIRWIYKFYSYTVVISKILIYMTFYMKMGYTFQ